MANSSILRGQKNTRSASIAVTTIAMMTMKPGTSRHMYMYMNYLYEDSFLSPSREFLSLSMWFEACCNRHMQYGKWFGQFFLDRFAQHQSQSSLSGLRNQCSAKITITFSCNPLLCSPNNSVTKEKRHFQHGIIFIIIIVFFLSFQIIISLLCTCRFWVTLRALL